MAKGEIKALLFSDGIEVAAAEEGPVRGITSLASYADDAAYVTAKGSAAAAGDIYYNTTINHPKWHNGTAWQTLVKRITVTDTTGWNGSQTTVTYDVSAYTTDARDFQWTLKNVSSNYAVELCEIDHPTANTNVRVTVGIPLASGTYYLVGV